MKLGVLVRDLGPSQFNYYCIRNANVALKSGKVADFVAFYENLTKPCLTPNFAIMQAAEAWGYDGVLVATTLSTAEKLIRFPSAQRKLFYVWDLEWLRMGQKSYRALQAVYGHSRLRLLARSAEHARLIGEVWNREAAIVDDFDLPALLKECSAT